MREMTISELELVNGGKTGGRLLDHHHHHHEQGRFHHDDEEKGMPHLARVTD